MLRVCIDALTGLSALGGQVLPEDASHAALLRFGFELRRLFADVERQRSLGDVLRSYRASPGRNELLLAICQAGRAFAVMGSQASCWACSEMQDVSALDHDGALDM